MSQIDSKTAVEFWKSGVPLDDAVEVFAIRRGLSKIRRKARVSALAAAESGKASFRKVDKNLDEFFDAVGTFHASFAGDVQVRSAKQAGLIERLRSGTLTAWGFPVHDRSANEPVQVPHFMLSHEFAKWQQRSFVGHDRNYADVTVCNAAEISIRAQDVSHVRKKTKRGPIPIDPLIADAIEYLRTVDPDFENRSQGKRINDIRSAVSHRNPGRYPKKSQPGHTTIWTYLKNSKSTS